MRQPDLPRFGVSFAVAPSSTFDAHLEAARPSTLASELCFAKILTSPGFTFLLGDGVRDALPAAMRSRFLASAM